MSIRITLTETVGNFGEATLAVEFQGEPRQEDVVRILKNALFGAEKVYERRLEGIASKVIGNATQLSLPDPAFRLTADSEPRRLAGPRRRRGRWQ